MSSDRSTLPPRVPSRPPTPDDLLATSRGAGQEPGLDDADTEIEGALALAPGAHARVNGMPWFRPDCDLDADTDHDAPPIPDVGARRARGSRRRTGPGTRPFEPAPSPDEPDWVDLGEYLAHAER